MLKNHTANPERRCPNLENAGNLPGVSDERRREAGLRHLHTSRPDSAWRGLYSSRCCRWSSSCNMFSLHHRPPPQVCGHNADRGSQHACAEEYSSAHRGSTPSRVPCVITRLTHDYFLPSSACRTSIARLVTDISTRRLHSSPAGESGQSRALCRRSVADLPTVCCCFWVGALLRTDVSWNDIKELIHGLALSQANLTLSHADLTLSRARTRKISVA